MYKEQSHSVFIANVFSKQCLKGSNSSVRKLDAIVTVKVKEIHTNNYINDYVKYCIWLIDNVCMYISCILYRLPWPIANDL